MKILLSGQENSAANYCEYCLRNQRHKIMLHSHNSTLIYFKETSHLISNYRKITPNPTFKGYCGERGLQDKKKWGGDNDFNYVISKCCAVIQNGTKLQLFEANLILVFLNESVGVDDFKADFIICVISWLLNRQTESDWRNLVWNTE